MLRFPMYKVCYHVPYEEGESARHTIDAAGKYVFPGLIDSHAHMFTEGTDIGCYPDLAYLPTGVTSAVDATAGVSNYRMFRSAIIERSKVTIKSFLQMCSAGLATTSYHENINPKYFNPEKIARIYHENKDNILGLKIRQSEELAEGLGIEPLKATVAIAEKSAARWRSTAPTFLCLPAKSWIFFALAISLSTSTKV